MPIFVPAGFVVSGLLPWLAGAISGMFFGLMQFFAKFVAKKLAVTLAVVAIMISLTTAFFLAVKSLVSVLSPVFPEYMTTAAGWFLPENTITLLGMIFAARLLRWTYDWHVKIVQMKLY